MQYSPKLKKAMAEIKAILERYDIGSVVVLHDVGFSEYHIKINPTYSVVKFDRFGQTLEIVPLASKGDFNKGIKAYREKLLATSNMLNVLATVGGSVALNVLEASKQFDKLVGAEHFPGEYLSQSEIDN